mgnify:CR=1 FL=1
MLHIPSIGHLPKRIGLPDVTAEGCELGGMVHIQIRLKVSPEVAWASRRLENARIDLKIGIRAKLTGPDRMVIFSKSSWISILAPNDD